MMEVIKRNGTRETIKFDKIASRIKKQTYGLNLDFVDPLKVTMKVISGVYDGVTTIELDTLAAETSAAMISDHPDYSKLAARIAITALHKDTSKSFYDTIVSLHDYVNKKTGKKSSKISEELFEVVSKNRQIIEEAIIYDRDFMFDYFGYKTLEKSYLLKIDGKIIERPQHLYMRVAIGIWGNDIAMVLKTYDLLSNHMYTHATPTLFNSGTPNAQMSSCFLVAMEDDSIEGIFSTIKDVAHISKWAGGVGISVSNLRATGSYIQGTGGQSSGLIPWLKILNETGRGVNQGGKRKGSFAIYLEPWHADVFDFLDIRKNNGKEEMRARDLFTAMWIPDLFMERVKNEGDWSLMCPAECPGLDEVYGEEFNALYTKYEEAGKFRKKIKAREVWTKIIESQIETGTPYILFKDAANRKNNQKNRGTLKLSNLCAEILEYSDEKESAVCNLASISLPSCIEFNKKGEKSKNKFDFDKLYDVTYHAAVSLNTVIDKNFYPTKKTKTSNMKMRPIGIGAQGLADIFAHLNLPFESEDAKKLSKEISETMYFAALTASKDIAKVDGPYEAYQGSPLSQGILQYELWDLDESYLSGRWDFSALKEEIKLYGVRNSLLLAQMPVASTAQIFGNNEANEPFTSNIYKRGTLSGDYVVVNKHLVNDLLKLNLWNEKMKLKLIANNGSVQNIQEIPQDIKDLYKTVWEIKQRNVIDMAADRGPFICQTQSMNLFFDNINAAKLTSALFYAWEKGLKTGMYYARSKPAAEAISGLGIDMSKLEDNISCSLDNPEACEACGA
jgi:ribonucleoside-diphosphate reductase alpha chain